jgi:hypothetical protein
MVILEHTAFRSTLFAYNCAEFAQILCKLSVKRHEASSLPAHTGTLYQSCDAVFSCLHIRLVKTELSAFFTRLGAAGAGVNALLELAGHINNNSHNIILSIC